MTKLEALVIALVLQILIIILIGVQKRLELSGYTSYLEIQRLELDSLQIIFGCYGDRTCMSYERV